MNLGGGSTPEGLEEFVTVTSDFYHDLGPYYRALPMPGSHIFVCCVACSYVERRHHGNPMPTVRLCTATRLAISAFMLCT
jgi:hypothetical protein